MKTYAQTILLRDDPAVLAAYRDYHDNIWPEVADGLRGAGILQMRIWLLGRQLFMVMDTTDEFDIERDFAAYEAGHPRRAEWQRLMESFQEPVADAKPGEWWAQMELVFTLNG
ncbi:MAG: L-rhamnose mutarotase [Dehalococcoidia bacterium]